MEKKPAAPKAKVDQCTFLLQIKLLGGMVIGGQTPLGLGIAYALKYKKKKVLVYVLWEMERRTIVLLRIPKSCFSLEFTGNIYYRK